MRSSATRPGPSEAQPHGRQEVVGGDYFRAMQIPVLQGRAFTDGDTTDSPRVVVIDQYLANRYFAEPQPSRPGNPARPGAAGPLHHRRCRRHHQQHRPRTAGREGAALLSDRSTTATGHGAGAEERDGPGAARLTGARGRPVARSRAADCRCSDDGRVDEPVAGGTQDADGAVRAVRRRRAAAVGDRDLRRAGVQRRAARPRVRDPAGARREQPVDPVAGVQAGAHHRRQRAC